MPNPDKEKRILSAAEELFASRRFHEVTLDDIRRRAGVGKGTIYRYFKNKDDLFLRMILSGYADLCLVIRASAAGNGDFMEQLRRALLKTRAFFRRRRPLFRLMQADEGRVPFWKGAFRGQWAENRRELLAAIAGILRRGVESGQIRSTVPPERLAETLLGMLRGYFGQSEAAEETPQAMSVLVNLFLHGAAVRTEVS